MDLSGKTAIVTGSTRNIGLAIARKLADNGAHVFIHGLHAKKVEQALALFPKGRAAGAAIDLSQMAGCERLVEQAVEVFGRIDILVNNAVQLGLNSYLHNLDQTQ